MYWYPVAIAIAVGIALGVFLVWFGSRRERRHARIVGEYVDALMAAGPVSLEALRIYADHAKDKDLLEAFNTAKDLYLAFSRAQKTDVKGRM